MGFWDKLEAWADKVEKNAKKFEEKADKFLDKNFPEEKEEFTSYGLLNLTKKNFDGIFSDKILQKAKNIRSTTTHFYQSLSKDITFSTIEELENAPYNNLATPQYKIIIKGLTVGQDDYNSATATFKFDVCVIIDKYSSYFIESVLVDTK